MRLLFVCSSLEPGKDGVGDYVRCLADKLNLLGNEVILISLNEKALDLTTDIGQRGLIRLSSSSSWKWRVRVLKNLCESFKPEWISLQYVPYGFAKTGLPFMLPIRLNHIDKKAKWHIMFHELWIGITKFSPWKHKVIGVLQRHIAKDLVHRLKPALIHTTNPLYVYLLDCANIKASRLPLFSSIGDGHNRKAWAIDKLHALGITSLDRDSWFLVGMFGSCYPDFPLEIQLHKAAAHADLLGKKLAVLGIGGGVGTGKPWEQRVQAAAPSALVCHFGRHEEDQIAALLSCLDMGMPCTPVEFLGKSSVAAAMVAHCATIDTSYSANLPEYQHLELSEWKTDSLFWPLEEVAQELLYSFDSAISNT